MKTAETIIQIERVSNGFIICTNDSHKAVATDKKEAGRFFGEMLINSIDSIKANQTVLIKINAELKQ